MLNRILQPVNLFYLLLPLAVWLARDNVFFWDTIQLGSKQAHWYYENEFSTFLLPEIIDSGHPPFFGMYLAVWWIIFGKNLMISHLAMLPFLLGMVLYLKRIGIYYGNRSSAFFLLCLFFADPVIASQSLLISPDVVLMFFFLMGLWSLLYNKRKILIIATIGLAMISMRGMMVVVMLYLFDVTRPFLKPRKAYNISFFKAIFYKMPHYVPSGLLAIAFLVYHDLQTGWVGYHADSPWAVSFERIEGIGGLIKNTAVLAWRYLDFGRIFLWMTGGIAIALILKKGWLNDYKLRQLLLLLLLGILILAPSQLMHKYLVVHRYNIPGFIALTFLVYYLLFSRLSSQTKWMKPLFLIAFTGLLTGNLWVYPKKISQGWDSTLAHLPYYQLRSQMLDFIEQSDIPKAEIGTAFPQLDAEKYRDLSGSEAEFSRKNLNEQEYILYSNIMNDFTDEEIDDLEQNWQVVKELKKHRVCFILYKQ